MTRVAIAQFESAEEVEANLAKMTELVEQAAEGGAELLLFHELASTNYFCYDDRVTDHFKLAEPIPGPSTDALLKAAKRAGVSVLLPLYERDGDERFNTVVYLDAQHGITGKYRKMHIPVLDTPNGQKGADEGFYFSAGDMGFVLPKPIAGISTGSVICYDRHFPEAGRSYALQGAHMLFVPTASYRDSMVGDNVWQSELQAYAFQNSVYVAGVNKIGPVVGNGTPDGARYPGGSVVFDPNGRLVAECGDGEEIAYVDVDPEVAESVRQDRTRFFNARRPEHYKPIVAQGSNL